MTSCNVCVTNHKLYSSAGNCFLCSLIYVSVGNLSMNFGRKQLEKYGWNEGEGLGKNKLGISKAIKPKLKFDTGGLGHDVFEDINNTWWQRLYDEAAKNIMTKTKGNDSVVLETVNDSIEITIKKKKCQKSKKAVYQNFIKTSELNHSVEKKFVDDEATEEPEKKKKEMTSGICDLTDEELFKICGERTAHKGARHGLKMNAKLARLEKQENSLSLGSDEVEFLGRKRKKSCEREKNKIK